MNVKMVSGSDSLFLGSRQPFILISYSCLSFMWAVLVNACLSPHLSLCPSDCPQVCRGSLWVGLFSFKTDKLKSSCPAALKFTSWMTRPVVKWWDRRIYWDICRVSTSIWKSCPFDLHVCPQRPPWLSSQAGSIIHMSVSFSYKYLALFTDTGHLFTSSSDLQVSCTCVQSAVFQKWRGVVYLNEWQLIFICRTNWVKLTPRGWRHLNRWSGI